MNVDVDEFYWPETGTLKGIFSAVPEECGKLMLPVSHFLPRPGDGFFADRMTVREVLSLKSGVGPSTHRRLTKVAHRAAADVEVSQGGHRAYGAGLDPLLGWEPIVGFHFPVRSYAQFESKVARDGRTADPKIRALRRELYEQHSASRLLDLHEQRVVDDAEARAGTAEGRFVVDERLKDFLGSGERAAPAEPTADEVGSLRLEMERAVEAYERHPLTTEVRALNAELTLARATTDKLSASLWRTKARADDGRATNARLLQERNVVKSKLKAERRKSKALRAKLGHARRRRRLPALTRVVTLPALTRVVTRRSTDY
jgi:hypothetical protein